MVLWAFMGLHRFLENTIGFKKNLWIYRFLGLLTDLMGVHGAWGSEPGASRCARGSLSSDLGLHGWLSKFVVPFWVP